MKKQENRVRPLQSVRTAASNTMLWIERAIATVFGYIFHLIARVAKGLWWLMYPIRVVVVWCARLLNKLPPVAWLTKRLTGWLDSLPLKPLWILGSRFFFAPENTRYWFVLAAILGLTYGSVQVGIGLAHVGEYVANAFQPYNREAALRWAAIGAAVVLLTKVVDASTAWFTTTLQLGWREWQCTKMIIAMYDRVGRPYVHLFREAKWKAKLEAPDYTMTQDANDLPNSWTNFAFPFGSTVLKLIQYGGILFGMSRVYPVSAAFWVAVSYVGVILLGHKLFKLSADQFNNESALKVLAGRPRTYAEAIAFGQGEEVAKVKLITRLHAALTTWRTTRNVNYWMQIFSGFVSDVIPYGMAALLAWFEVKGGVNYGVVIVTTAYFTNFFKAANVLPDQFGNIANLTKILERMATFTLATENPPDDAGGPRIQVRVGDVLAFDNVTIQVPESDRVLWKDFTYALKKKDPEKSVSLLIVAIQVEAQGLTALARTIIGWFNHGNGTVTRPNLDKIMFFEEVLDLMKGTFRELLSYPKVELIKDNDRLTKAITQAKLGYLLDPSRTDIGGLDGVEKDWQELTDKEQQRLFIVWCLLREPRLVFIDRQLEDDVEQDLLNVLHLLGADIVRTTRAPTASMLANTDEVIELKPEGQWNPPVPASGYKLAESNGQSPTKAA
jgi:putative ATP-binding cassette transporter